MHLLFLCSGDVDIEPAALAAFLCGNDARGITAENIQITGGALW